MLRKAAVAMAFLALCVSAAPVQGQTAYGTDRSSALYELNPGTGATTLVGALGIGPVTGSAIDPSSGIYYTNPGGGGCCPTPTSGCLYSVSLASGAATQVGCDPIQGGNDPIPGLAFGPDGHFYGVRLAYNAAPEDGQMHLCRIDRTTGVLTDIGPIGDWCRGHGAAFGADGNLYVWNDCDGLTRVSTSDASQTVIGGGFVGFPQGFDSPRIPDMARAPDGTLWAIVVDGGEGEYYSATATVDTTTGDVTFVATLSEEVNTIEFTGTAAGPMIIGIVPPYGPVAGGITVTITGTGLSGATSVTFDGLTATITGNTDTTITVILPPHAVGPVDVVVTTLAGTARLTNGFLYVDGALVPTLSGWMLGLLAAALAAAGLLKLRT